MNKGYIVAIVVILVLVVGGLAYWYSTQPGQPVATSTQTPPQTQTTPEATSTTATPTPAPATVTVTYTNDGFSPGTITISKGDTVVFKNAASSAVRVSSNPHPIHDGYPTTGGCVGSTFDSCSNIAPGGLWSFTFDIVGSWGYHNHLNPSKGGTIVVSR